LTLGDPGDRPRGGALVVDLDQRWFMTATAVAAPVAIRSGSGPRRLLPRGIAIAQPVDSFASKE
jgi:hypothetical protein